MKIACLGWGSLVWKPGSLLTQEPWFEDGPFLPVDFLRQSNDGRLTLVIDERRGTIVKTLWILMATPDLGTAKESLRVREGIPINNFAAHVSFIETGSEPRTAVELIVKNWALAKHIDAVIWTGLPCKFRGINNEAPSEDEAVAHLKRLDPDTRKIAEEYIRKAPAQIVTALRRRFFTEFGW